MPSRSRAAKRKRRSVARRAERSGVVYGKCEHAAEPVNQTFYSPLLITMDQHLRVGCAREIVTGRRQFGAEFAVVVDLSVEGHPNGALLIRHRLFALGPKIDNGQPAVTEEPPGPSA